MGMFKDLRGLLRSSKQLRDSFPMPSMRDSIQQMRETVDNFSAQQADQNRLLAEGIPGTAIIREMGTPERGATWFNLTLDLEVHPKTREPYRVANEYLVPAAVHLEPGVELPVKVDPADPAKLAIDWGNAPRGPALGEVRPL
jgi:hypothetical protein